jgi:hypothetical protein
MNITKNTLRYLIKEAMYGIDMETPESHSYIENEVEEEVRHEISWAKVLDSLNPQREENSDHFRLIIIKAITNASEESSEFLLDMMEDVTEDSEVRAILMNHVEKIFKNEEV